MYRVRLYVYHTCHIMWTYLFNVDDNTGSTNITINYNENDEMMKINGCPEKKAMDPNNPGDPYIPVRPPTPRCGGEIRSRAHPASVTPHCPRVSGSASVHIPEDIFFSRLLFLSPSCIPSIHRPIILPKPGLSSTINLFHMTVLVLYCSIDPLATIWKPTNEPLFPLPQARGTGSPTIGELGYWSPLLSMQISSYPFLGRCLQAPYHILLKFRAHGEWLRLPQSTHDICIRQPLCG